MLKNVFDVSEVICVCTAGDDIAIPHNPISQLGNSLVGGALTQSHKKQCPTHTLSLSLSLSRNNGERERDG